ncbi:hypothetical protein [Cyclonatronum proteinivorum]|nr:hypothetical protein [Cyclonatronum proteinivorum]
MKPVSVCSAVSGKTVPPELPLSARPAVLISRWAFLFLWCLGVMALQLVPAVSVVAQSAGQTERILEIKQSGNYHWGEAFHENREQALSLARQDLIERIVVFVTSESEVRVSENDEAFRSEVMMRNRSISRMELRGAGHIEVQRRDGSWRTTAYISREDFARTLDIEAGRIRTALSQAQTMESLGNINGAMAIWMDVLAAASFFPEPVFVSASATGPDSDNQVEAGFISRERILHWLNAADISVRDVRNQSAGENIEMYLDLEIRFGNQPAELIEAALDRRDTALHTVAGGFTSVYVDQPRSNARETLTLRLMPSAGSGMNEEAALVLERIRPVSRRSVSVDWRPALPIDIETVALSGGRVRLIPHTPNLSVFNLRWNIDGRSTSETTPVVTFQPGSDVAEVSLRLNNNEQLSVQKSIHRSGRITAVSGRQQPRPGLRDTQTSTRNPWRASDTPPSESPSAADAAVTSVLDELLRIRIGDQLITHLNRLQEEGRLLVGNRGDMPEAAQSYVAVINPVNRRVEAVLSPAHNGLRTRLPGTTSFTENEIPERFRNMGTVWFYFTEP